MASELGSRLGLHLQTPCLSLSCHLPSLGSLPPGHGGSDGSSLWERPPGSRVLSCADTWQVLV